MEGLRARVSHVLGWPAAQLRRVAEQVAGKLQASSEAERARFAKARAENAGKVIEVSPPSSRGSGAGTNGNEPG